MKELLKFFFLFIFWMTSESCYAQKLDSCNLVLQVTISFTDTVSMRVGNIEIFENEALFMDDILSNAATISVFSSEDDVYLVDIKKNIPKRDAGSSELSSNNLIKRFKVNQCTLKSLFISIDGFEDTFSFQLENGRYLHLNKDFDRHEVVLSQKKEPVMFK